MKPKREAILVVGMHRSGTSALGGVLARLGVQAPRSLMPPGRDNPKGYWESGVLMQTHDRILSSAGSRWSDWGKFNPDWFESAIASEFHDILSSALRSEYVDAPIFFVKDPRISRFLPFWLESLKRQNAKPKVVISIRHPLEVAESLRVRNQFGPRRSLLLWLRHVLDSEFHSRGAMRSFVEYETLLTNWQAVIGKISRDLRIKWPRRSGEAEAEIEEFLTAALRHHAADGRPIRSDDQIFDWARQTFDCLLGLAESGDAPDALAQLDEIRADFDRTSSIFSTVVREHEVRLEDEVAEQKSVLQKTIKQHEELISTTDGREQDYLRSEAFLVQKEAHIKELTHELGCLKVSIEEAAAASRSDLAALEEAHKEREEERRHMLDVHRAAISALERQLVEQEKRAQQLDAQWTKERSALTAAAKAAEEARVSCDARATEREVALQELSRSHERLMASHEENLAKLDATSAECAGVEALLEDRFRETAKLTMMVFQLEGAVEDTGRQLQQEKQQSEAVASGLKSALQESEASRAASELASKQSAAVIEFAMVHREVERKMLCQTAELWEMRAKESHKLLLRVLSSRRWRLGRIFGPEVEAPEDLEISDGRSAHEIHLLRRSPLFDSHWYRSQYMRDAGAEIDPIIHYMRCGAPAGFDPGPDFSTKAYLHRYPDVRRSGMNPLVHFLEHGEAEGRMYAPLSSPGT